MLIENKALHCRHSCRALVEPVGCDSREDLSAGLIDDGSDDSRDRSRGDSRDVLRAGWINGSRRGWKDGSMAVSDLDRLVKQAFRSETRKGSLGELRRFSA
jgi:hypothetical protein